MPKQIFNPSARYQTINVAARMTGLSSKWLRERVKSGELKFLTVGSEYRLDMSYLWHYLDALTEQGDA